jgi:hypothetical protein
VSAAGSCLAIALNKHSQAGVMVWMIAPKSSDYYGCIEERFILGP